MARNFMYKANLATAAAEDWAQKERDLAEANRARSEEGGWTSLASIVGSVVGAYFFGPVGAAVGGGLGSWGADELIDSESKRVRPGKFYSSEADKINQELSSYDRAADWGHVWTGLERGAQAYTIGEATGLGGFGEEGASFSDRMFTPYGGVSADISPDFSSISPNEVNRVASIRGVKNPTAGELKRAMLEAEGRLDEGGGLMDWLGTGWGHLLSGFGDPGYADEDETYGEVYTP